MWPGTFFRNEIDLPVFKFTGINTIRTPAEFHKDKIFNQIRNIITTETDL